NGGSGNDVMDGGAGDDVLSGGSGNDALEGGAGDDILAGGSGNDILHGGLGDDVLTGGEGDDIFVFGGEDRIADFSIGSDRIDLRKLGITTETFDSQVILTGLDGDMLVTIGSSRMTVSDINPMDVDIDSFILANESGANTPPLIEDFFAC